MSRYTRVQPGDTVVVRKYASKGYTRTLIFEERAKVERVSNLSAWVRYQDGLSEMRRVNLASVEKVEPEAS